MFGPLAALASGGQVGDLDGGGSAPDRRACQVFGCGLVLLVQAGGAGIGLHPGRSGRERGRYTNYLDISNEIAAITLVVITDHELKTRLV